MYRLDIGVERKAIVDVKSVEEVLPVHEKQVLTYLQLTGQQAWPSDKFQCACLETRYSQDCFGFG
jgi:hypothetical protein